MFGLWKTTLIKAAAAGYGQVLYAISSVFLAAPSETAAVPGKYGSILRSTFTWAVQSVGETPSSAYAVATIAALLIQHILSFYQ
jgi:hypothetical protein